MCVYVPRYAYVCMFMNGMCKELSVDTGNPHIHGCMVAPEQHSLSLRLINLK